MSSFKANRGIALLISPVRHFHLTRCHCVRVRKKISLIKIAPTKDVCSGQCEKCWRCSPAKTNIWLWCKASSASNTLKPIAGTHRRDEGEASSPSSSYLLTLRASLFPGNRVEVSGVPWCAKCFFLFLFLWLWIHCDWYSLVCSDGRKHGMTRCGAWSRVFWAQEQAKWALPMWQCGTFQAQMNKTGKSTWMHMQISEHTVVLQKKKE